MIVYNVTIKINKEIEAEWIQWQNAEHIPDVMSTGFFTEYKFYKLLELHEEDGLTFVVQYFTNDIENYNRYIKESAPGLRKKAEEKWGENFIAFRTLMQTVN